MNDSVIPVNGIVANFHKNKNIKKSTEVTEKQHTLFIFLHSHFRSQMFINNRMKSNTSTSTLIKWFKMTTYILRVPFQEMCLQIFFYFVKKLQKVQLLNIKTIFTNICIAVLKSYALIKSNTHDFNAFKGEHNHSLCLLLWDFHAFHILSSKCTYPQ